MLEPEKSPQRQLLKSYSERSWLSQRLIRPLAESWRDNIFMPFDSLPSVIAHPRLCLPVNAR
jgi:hypothetical protein